MLVHFPQRNTWNVTIRNKKEKKKQQTIRDEKEKKIKEGNTNEMSTGNCEKKMKKSKKLHDGWVPMTTPHHAGGSGQVIWL